MREAKSMEECIYFTNRSLDGDGHVKAWVFKATCPKCKKGSMGKPVEKGKIKIRANEYVCPECGYSEEKSEHEEKLELNIIYTCPYCGHEGETTIGYNRKRFEGVPAYVFVCQACNEKIGITKKMKKGKKKEKK